MSNTVIQVENLSKQYRLGEVSTGSLGHDLNRWWHRVRGKDDPYLKVTQTNVREEKVTTENAEGTEKRKIRGSISAFSFHPSSLSSDYVWALKDINFEVKRGEVLGIIGRNGAGKSTLLKILSRVTAPTTGEVRIKGRIASLLEVGTGFHPQLTGRENIYLNGAILGMTKPEITSKLDEIVEFSGCARYIDTPVKRYSSGMMVRLGFAVAAHLEPEILIVDEVLAVGDAEFQRKCIGKMQDVASHGRTVLFVSHNMASIKDLCQSALSIENGRLRTQGSASDVVDEYLASSTHFDSSIDSHAHRVRSGLQVQAISFGSTPSASSALIPYGKPVVIRLQIQHTSKQAPRFFVGIHVKNGGMCLCTLTSPELRIEAMSTSWFQCVLSANILRPGLFNVTVGLTRSTDRQLLDLIVDVAPFMISPPGAEDDVAFCQRTPGIVNVPAQWDSVGP